MKGQNPVPSNAMQVYKQMLFNRLHGWEMVVYATDEHGRKWTATVSLAEPSSLGLGERVFDSELE